MKHWHWFPNRPSFCFTVGPHAAALVQRLMLRATVFQPNPTRYGRHTHSSFKQTKAAHNDQPCHYGTLIWSGPGHAGFISFVPIQMCVTASARVPSVFVCVCERVPIQTNGGGLGRSACSSARPLIAIYILGESSISNSPYYLSSLHPSTLCQCHGRQWWTWNPKVSSSPRDDAHFPSSLQFSGTFTFTACSKNNNS